VARRLALDTSGTEYAMVLIEDGRCAASLTWTRTGISPPLGQSSLPPRGRAGEGAPAIVRLADLLEGAGWSPRDLDAVAAGRGPGSFTGLRVGLSLAAGLAYGRQIPLYLVDSLELVAARALGEAASAVLRDASRKEVYAWRRREGAVRLPVQAIDAWLRPGDRVLVEPIGALKSWAPNRAGLELPADQQQPLSDAMVMIANEVFDRAKPVRYDELQALYSQPAAAEERKGNHP
jgi:tRNA threonylcarbamoyladenosine biosynthesis protein TsaB